MKTDKRYTTDKKAARHGIAGTLLAALLFASSCSHEDMLDNGAYPADGARLTVTVTDGGYLSSGEPRTRAVEKGYATEFTAGDAAGLYAVNAEGKLWIENVKVTAEQDGDGGTVTWSVPAGTTLMHTPQTKYFLYYPYQPDMTVNKVDTGAETAEKFFRPLIDGWQPKTDQSKYADYTASDLMVAKGVVGKIEEEHLIPLTFTMTHCMALAVIEMPGTLYHITSYNSETTKCDFYIFDGVDAQFSGENRPYRPEDHPVGEGSADYHYRRRYIVRPDKGYTQNGEYMDKADEVVHNYEVVIRADDLKTGCYTLCKVDGGLKEKEGDYHHLEIVRIGDLFCPTADRSDWYLVPHEVEKLAGDDEPAGIVFQTDKRRFGSAETDFFGGREAMHGLVVSVKRAELANGAILLLKRIRDWLTARRWRTVTTISAAYIIATISRAATGVSRISPLSRKRTSTKKPAPYPSAIRLRAGICLRAGRYGIFIRIWAIVNKWQIRSGRLHKLI